MTLKAKIQEDIKQAMRAKDSTKLTTLRMITAAIKQIEVDQQIEVDEAMIISILTKMVKQRKDAAKIYHDANRNDMAEKEEAEITLLQEYLPKMLSDAEIDQAIQAAITQVGAEDMKQMGKVMGLLKNSLAGKADMSIVSKLLKDALSH